MPFAPALWFLPCFWLCSVVYAMMGYLSDTTKCLLIIFLTIAGMAYSSLSYEMLPICIEPLAVSLIFVLVGEIIRKHENRIWPWLEKWWIIILLLVIETILAFVNGSCDMRSARYHNCFLYLINSVVGTLGYWGLVRITIKLPFNISKKMLSYLSINSISFVCMNQVFINLWQNIKWIVNINSVVVHIIYKLFVFLFAIGTCVIFNEIIKKSRFHAI